MTNHRLGACVAFLLVSLILGCGNDSPTVPSLARDYRQDMRDFVQGISRYAKEIEPAFVVIPQNGQELLTLDGEPSGELASAYVSAIDGVGREDLFYGYETDNLPTPAAERDWMLAFLDLAESYGIEVLVTDYCSTHEYVDDSYQQSFHRGYISFAADHRELDNIPSYPARPFEEHPLDVDSLADAKNFLYVLDPSKHADRQTYLDALRATTNDVLLIDPFYGNSILVMSEVASLKVKANGGTRLVIAYMSIGEAEEYRYYWQVEWETAPPPWLAGMNPDWPGNFKVRYWDEDWQRLIFGQPTSYLNQVLAAGFDGVYLDIIDAFEYFESGER